MIQELLCGTPSSRITDHEERSLMTETGSECWTKESGKKEQVPKKNGHEKEGTTAASEPQLEGWTAAEFGVR